MTNEEMKKLCDADYALRCIYPVLSEENKKALDIALNLINEKLNNFTKNDDIIRDCGEENE